MNIGSGPHQVVKTPSFPTVALSLKRGALWVCFWALCPALGCLFLDRNHAVDIMALQKQAPSVGGSGASDIGFKTAFPVFSKNSESARGIPRGAAAGAGRDRVPPVEAELDETLHSYNVTLPDP